MITPERAEDYTAQHTWLARGRRSERSVGQAGLECRIAVLYVGSGRRKLRPTCRGSCDVGTALRRSRKGVAKGLPITGSTWPASRRVAPSWDKRGGIIAAKVRERT